MSNKPEGQPLVFNMQQLLRGVKSDSMSLRNRRARFNEEGEAVASREDIEALTQNYMDRELPRMVNRPSEGSGGWSPDQYYPTPQGNVQQVTNPFYQPADLPVPPPSWDPNNVRPEKLYSRQEESQPHASEDMVMQALYKAHETKVHQAQQLQEDAAQQEQQIEYDASGLMDKLSLIKQQAQMQGKNVQMNVATSQRAEYFAVFRQVMKTMAETTGMTIDPQGGYRILCYWVSDDGKFTGFNRVYVDNGTHLGLALVDEDNVNVEDTLAQVSYGESLEEFKDNTENFFCNLYTKHLGIEV